MNINQQQLELWLEEAKAFHKQGEVAQYIPELTRMPPDLLGICLQPIGQQPYFAGDSKVKFTLQSVSKVFTLILALMDRGEDYVFDKVGMEPTGDFFNSMVKLELVQPGKPFNPMINAGAITITSMIQGDHPHERFLRILDFVRLLSGDASIGYDEDVYVSEAKTADRNRSLAYFLKHNKVLEGDVNEHLEVYFKQCAIHVCTEHVARMAMILANRGMDPETNVRLIPQRYVQIATAFMSTCGMYNASGEFALQVGLPAKSGVSGCIMAVAPSKMGIGVFGPSLSVKGNSVAGVELLRKISQEWQLSIF